LEGQQTLVPGSTLRVREFTRNVMNWKTAQVQSLPKKDSATKDPRREERNMVPSQLLVSLAAAPLPSPTTFLKKSTMLKNTPKYAVYHRHILAGQNKKQCQAQETIETSSQGGKPEKGKKGANETNGRRRWRWRWMNYRE
jgi:hypothetical protein